LSFALDGRRLASASEDHTALVWDATHYLPHRQIGMQLSQEELHTLWVDLSDADAAKAYRAMNALAARPEKALLLMEVRLQQAQPPSPDRMAQLIADLDNAEFAVRNEAIKRLGDLESFAETAMRKALDGKPSVEARRHLERLLARLKTPTAGRLR